MSSIGWIEIALYCAIIVALVLPLGWYITRVFNRERTFLSPALRPVEAVLYRSAGVDPARRGITGDGAAVFRHRGKAHWRVLRPCS
jgi:K+-transporting ATPase ATPase A chain